ncbi:MAG: T9SS type A sorting domain-containing protein [Flavobacteriales bacterium]|nr:T9SS type A sorting domain-containing protein [Flavobacteriales bacterium]
MKNIATLFLLAICSITLITSQAQECRTDEIYEQNSPDIKKLDAVIAKKLRNNVRKNLVADSVIIVPVVFHVLEWGASPSDAQLIKDIADLNEDFAKLNSDTSKVRSPFDQIIGSPRIQFRLAQIDPDGNCTTGITRHRDQKTNGTWERDGSEAYKKEIQAKWNNIWDPSNYLNFYLMWEGTYAHATQAGADEARPNQSGVVGFAWFKGANAIMTHEVGHWLGLGHTFSGGCNGAGDNIDDTPPCTTTTGCVVDENTCDEGAEDLPDNLNNYLSYNSCRYMFTENQATRMQDYLAIDQAGRKNLGTLTNLIGTGTEDPYEYGSNSCAPIVEINENTDELLCPGDETSFDYTSSNGTIDSVLWEFPGGTPSSSTEDKPDVNYSNGGTYDVMITAYSNGMSEKDTLWDAIDIKILDGGIAYPYAETFEVSDEFDSLWTVINNNNDNFLWALTATASYQGLRSIRMRNNGNAVNNQTDEIVSPFIDLSANTGSTVFSFMIAGAQNGSANDRLEILFSKTCGQTWNKFYTKIGSELATVTKSTNNFVPSSTDEWRQDFIMLPAGYNVSDVQFKFKFKSNLGSHLYIDNINYHLVGINDLSTENSVRIFPNPINDQSVIEFTSIGNEDTQIEIADLTGRIIASIYSFKSSKGNNHINIGSHIKTKGTYFIRLTIEDDVVVKKVISN